MTKLSGLCAALALWAAFVQPSLAQTTPPTADTVVATVNGATITLGDVIVTRQALPAQYQSMSDEELFPSIVNQLVQQEALRQTLGDKLSKRSMLAITGLARSYLSNEALQAGIKDAVSEAEIQKAYDAKYKDMEPSLEYHAAHILVDSEDKAKALLAEIEAGLPFADAAKANSTDGNAASGGDLGWIGLGATVKPFEDAVVAAPVGKAIGPIKTDFGWHLIFVSETRNKAAPPLADVQDQITAEVRKAAIDAFIMAVTDQITITRTLEGIDPALIKDVTLLDE